MLVAASRCKPNARTNASDFDNAWPKCKESDLTSRLREADDMGRQVPIIRADDAAAVILRLLASSSISSEYFRHMPAHIT